MKLIKKSSIALLSTLSLLSHSVYAEEPKNQWGILAPTLFTSSDSDHFHVTKLGAGILPFYADGQHYLGVQATNTHYSSLDWAKDGSQVSLIQRSINSETGLGSIASAGVSRVYGRDLLTADISYSAPINASLSYEAFFFRDWVETRNSLSNGISHNYYGGSLEQKITKDWTVIGLLAQQKFSDDNIRNHVRGKLIYDLLPDLGINLQFRHRQYRDSHDYTPNYFNPNEYQENMMVMGWRRRIQQWQLSGVAGLGRQKINEDPFTTTKLFEFEAISPIFNKVFLRTKAGYSDSAGFGGPDYSYRYFQADIIFSFN
jgi:hypothetical protein